MHPPIIQLLITLIGLYGWVVFLYVLGQLLIYFKVLNSSQQIVAMLMKFFGGLVEPVLEKIRKYVKPYNNMDFSPAILLLLIYFVQYTLSYYF